MFFLTLLLLSGFSLFVANTWFHYHILGTGDHWLWIAFPLAVYGVIAGGVAFLLSRSKEPHRPSPLSLFTFLLITLFIIFNAQVFLRPMFVTGMSLFPGLGVIAANLSFGKMIFSVLAMYGILTLLFTSTGSLIFRLTRFSHQIASVRPDLLFTLRFITGLGVWVGILILYHWIGLLGTRPLLYTAVVIFLLEYRRLTDIVRACLQKSELPVTRDPFSLLIGIFLLFLIAFNIAETVRPLPTGYDDMIHYMNRVTLMTERQSLLEKASLYDFELLAAGISIATGESGPGQQRFALSFGAYGLLIGTLFIFLFGRALFGFRAGLVAAAIFLSAPMGPALALLETKPDSLLMPIVIAMVWFLLEAERSKNTAVLYLACYSFGLVMGTKLTGAIFAPGLAFGFLFIVWTGHLSWFKTIRTALFSLFFFSLAFAPWLLHGELEKARAYLHPDTQTTLNEDLSQELWGNGGKCSFLGQTEDMLRFDPEPGWSLKEIVMAPWHMTMNRYVSLFATEAGFLYLAILPLGLLILFRVPRAAWLNETSKPILLIAVTVLGAVALWGIYAEHIAWYLYPVLPLFSLLVAAVFEYHQKFRILYWLLATLILIGIFGNSLVRMKFGSAEPRLRYAAGTISADAYAEAVFPGYRASMDILNLDPEARILVAGSRHWYGIRDNDTRAYLDTHLEAFSCLLNRYGPDGTLAALKHLDVRYIFFPKSLLNELDGTSRPTFTKKISEFVEFSRTHLRVVWGSPYHIIYEVPSEISKRQINNE